MAMGDSFFVRLNSVSESSCDLTLENIHRSIRLLPIIPVRLLRDSVVPDYVRPPCLQENSLY